VQKPSDVGDECHPVNGELYARARQQGKQGGLAVGSNSPRVAVSLSQDSSLIPTKARAQDSRRVRLNVIELLVAVPSFCGLCSPSSPAEKVIGEVVFKYIYLQFRRRQTGENLSRICHPLTVIQQSCPNPSGRHDA
jgi:hypothetical protein